MFGVNIIKETMEAVEDMEAIDQIPKEIFDNSNPNYCRIDITPHQGTSMRISRDKSYIVFGTREGNVVAYNQLTQTIEKDVNASASSLWNLFLSNDSSFILAGGVDTEIKYLTFPEMELRESLIGHTREINHIIICDSNTECYSASDDGSVRFWDIPDRTGTTKYSHNSLVYALDMSTDENFLVSGAGDGSIILFDIAKNVIKWTSRLSRSIWCAKISNYMNYVVTGDSSGYVTLMTFQGDIIRNIGHKHTDRLRCMDFATDEKFFVSSGNDHRVKIWEVDSWREEITFDYHTDWIKAVAIDMENRTFTSIGDDCAIYIVKIPEFSTNFYLPDEFRKDKVLYFCETNCFYTIRSGVLYVCTDVGLEIINEIKIKELKDVESVNICKCVGKIGIAVNKLILTIDIFTFEIKSFHISANMVLPVRLFEHYAFVTALDEVSIISTHSLEILGSHPNDNINCIESVDNRIFFCNKTKIFEVTTEKLLFEYDALETVLMRVLPHDRLLAIGHSKLLSVFSITNTRHLIHTTSLEDIPLQLLSHNQNFFLIYHNLIRIYSSENYLQVSNIVTTREIFEITPLDADTVICCDEYQATLVKFCGKPVGSCSIAWTSEPYKSETNTQDNGNSGMDW